MTETTTPPAEAELSPAEEVAHLERELRFDLVEDGKAAQRDLVEAEGRNNPHLVTQARARLQANAYRNNDIIINQLPLARCRAARAQAQEAASRRQSMPAMSPSALADAIAEAEGRVAALGAEQAELPARLRHASEVADVEGMVEHRRRLDELPLHLRSARSALLRLQITELEAEEAGARDGQPAAVKALEAALVALDAAQEKFKAAQLRHGMLLGGQREARSDAAQLRHQLAELLTEEGLDRGPIVRSRIHAGKGLGNG